MSSFIHLAFGMNSREKIEITTWRFYGKTLLKVNCFVKKHPFAAFFKIDVIKNFANFTGKQLC